MFAHKMVMCSAGVPPASPASPGSKIWVWRYTDKSFLLAMFFSLQTSVNVRLIAVSQRDPKPAIPEGFLTSTSFLWNKWTSLATDTLSPHVPGLCLRVEMNQGSAQHKSLSRYFTAVWTSVGPSCPRGLSSEDDTKRKCLPRNVSNSEVRCNYC